LGRPWFSLCCGCAIVEFVASVDAHLSGRGKPGDDPPPDPFSYPTMEAWGAAVRGRYGTGHLGSLFSTLRQAAWWDDDIFLSDDDSDPTGDHKGMSTSERKARALLKITTRAEALGKKGPEEPPDPDDGMGGGLEPKGPGVLPALAAVALLASGAAKP